MPVQRAVRAFLPDTPTAWTPLGNGHINATWKVNAGGQSYVLQQINTYVFRQPEKLMENVAAVTAHIHRQGGRALEYLPGPDGKFWFQEKTGEFWRMYRFVDGFCPESLCGEADLYACARAFGQFQRQMADFPARTLFETIPRFHDTENRYDLLLEAMRRDAAGRAHQAEAETSFCLLRRRRACGLCALQAQNALPLRVTHNDTKVNNALLDRKTRAPLCVLDLDTVMPGLIAYDFGDAIRSGAATAAEDEQNRGKMGLDLNRYALYVRGYLKEANLTESERRSLALGAYAMTMECGVRFLTDYLDGDVYFRIDFPAHNLVRARAQFALAADMERKWDDMQRIVGQAALPG